MNRSKYLIDYKYSHPVTIGSRWQLLTNCIRCPFHIVVTGLDVEHGDTRLEVTWAILDSQRPSIDIALLSGGPRQFVLDNYEQI